MNPGTALLLCDRKSQRRRLTGRVAVHADDSTCIPSHTGHVSAGVARNVMVVEHFGPALANWDEFPASGCLLTLADLDVWPSKHHEGRRI